MKKHHISMPNFDEMTYEEEATWWESHDTAEFWNQMEEVDIKIHPQAFEVPIAFKKLSKSINIRLNEKDHLRLKKLASKKGLGAATLARMWILEHLL